VARLTALVGLALSGVVAAFATISPEPDAAELARARTPVVETLALRPQISVTRSPATYVREETFARGDTLARLLARLGVSDTDTRLLLRSRALRLLRPGSSVDATVSGDGELLSLNFLIGRDSLVTVQRAGGAFHVEQASAALSTRLAIKWGVIHSSLFGATDAAGVPDSVAMQLADIFGGDIDFYRELRQGDRFAVIYEMRYLNGRPVRSGRVLAAEFVNQGKSYRAVYYTGADGRGGYYGPDGSSLRKAFLRAPLEFSRISSGFGMRLHPFLKIWKQHRGIDYAAPTGTRVRAAGDGVVQFAGRKGGYGNVIILRHWGPYSTVYGHLHGFAPGIRRGTRVTQGEVIGYVGQTGWATGPHLHYEFRIAGVARNPLTIAMPSAQPVAARELAAYRGFAAPLVAQLDLLTGTDLALLE
jgi:murein DD-endopeptidase MepM/ murein hydrolase activator NlpD